MPSTDPIDLTPEGPATAAPAASGPGDDPARRLAVTRAPLATVAVALAACSTLAAGIGLVQFPSAVLADQVPWATTAMVCGVLMLVLCLVQAVGWRLVAAGRARATRGTGLRQVSAAVHVLSYGVVLVGLFAAASLAVAESSEPAPLVLTLVAAVALVAAQIMGAADFVRDGGLGGTVPDHLRRVREFDRHRRAAPDTD